MVNDINDMKIRLHNLRKQIESFGEFSQHMPSEYWMEYAKVFEYVFSMREEVVKNIRHHTDMLTSAHPHQYFNATPEFKNKMINAFLRIQHKLQSHKFTEPSLAGGFGFKYTIADSEVLINQDLIRYMEVFEKLAENDLLKDNYNMIVELGGGLVV